MPALAAACVPSNEATLTVATKFSPRAAGQVDGAVLVGALPDVGARGADRELVADLVEVAASTLANVSHGGPDAGLADREAHLARVAGQALAFVATAWTA